MNQYESFKYVPGLLLLALVTVFIGGCDSGPTVYPVSGQVLINGQPLAAGVEGFIQVIPDDGRASTGRIDPTDGTFTLGCFGEDDGCIPGDHKVTVTVITMAGGRSLSLIPEEYGNPDETSLTATIDGPIEDLKIELTGELKPLPADAGDDAGDDPGP
jgi:hypothetical protein